MDFEAVVEKGNAGIQALTESILPNIEDPEFCAKACDAVSNMAVDSESRSLFGEAGVVIDLIEILVKHKNNKATCSAACNAVRSVIFDSGNFLT